MTTFEWTGKNSLQDELNVASVHKRNRPFLYIVYPKSQNRTICEDRAEIKKQKVWRSDKHALTYEPETSIQAIADRFGFSEQASFARYFKKNTGVTPTEYREGK